MSTTSTTTIWLAISGLVLVLAGPISYALLLRVPWIRATAAPNLALAAVGLILGVVAAARAGHGWPAWLAAGDVLLTLMFVGVLFGLFRLPTPSKVPADQATAPDFTLPDQDGRPVTLSSFRGKGPVLLVFYRGHW